MQGYCVTALFRLPEKLDRTDETIRLLKGDVMDGSPVRDRAMIDKDEVISTPGVGSSFKRGDLIARSAPMIVGAMVSKWVSRLIFVSA